MGGVNAQNPSNGQTLLIYAVIIGNFDLVKDILNNGADVSIKDEEGLDALDYALKFGQYKITEIIFYRSLSGKTGNDLKRISTEIHTKNKEAEYIKNKSPKLIKEITQFTINAIKERAPFDPSMLFYAWQFNQNSLTSPLWTVMMETYEQILSDTQDKNGWKWLKEQFINSLIWFLPHPNAEEEKEENAMEGTLKKTLFYELLKRVRRESKKQSDLLLKHKIDSIKSEHGNDWQQLIKYDVLTKKSANARQDAYINSKYKEHELSEDKFPPSTHFSAKKFYDTNIYLNDLLFTANILDDAFQQNMMSITKEIGHEIGEKVTFRKEPVKTLTCAKAEVENDYIAEQWPKSAKILNFNRCALQFETVASLMKFLKNFEVKVKNGTAGCVKEIIRCRNGWSVYNEQLPSYADIKLNVLLKSEDDKSIIAEIQFLLDVMSAYKKVAHKLYSVERKFELVYNYQLMADKVSKFKDYNDVNIALDEAVNNDDIISFKGFWESHSVDFKVLLKNDRFIKILQRQSSQIYNYLQTETEYHHICVSAAYEMIKIFPWQSFLSRFDTDYQLIAIQKLFAFFVDKNEKLSEFALVYKAKDNLSLIEHLLKNKMTNSLQYVLLNKQINNENKYKTLTVLLPTYSWNDVLKHFDAEHQFDAFKE